MMSFKPRNALQVLASLAAALFLATAVARVVVVPVSPAVPVAFESRQAAVGVLRAEVRACMAGSHRSHEECLDEVEGKDLIQSAEWLAQVEASRGSAHGDTALDADAGAADRPPRSGAQ